MPSSLRPSFDLSMDTFHTILVPEHASAHVVSANSPPLEQLLSIGSSRVEVQCRGGVPMVFDFWWYVHLAVALKIILGCPDHATHLSHCSLGQSNSSVIAKRRCFQGGCGSCRSCFSIAASGHLCRTQRVHPLCQLLCCMRICCPSYQRRVQRPLLFVDPSRATSVWHLRSDSHGQRTQVEIDDRALDASDVDVQNPPSHTVPAPIQERHVRHHMTFSLGFPGCARIRQQPGTFFILCSITLAIHVPNLHLSWPSSTPPRSTSTLEQHLHFSRV